MIKDIPINTHKRLIRFEDDDVGLRGFIAIHNTKLGPATGGTRFKSYNSEDEAISDSLNLSRAMTYKCALAGVPYGGGKSVIISNGQKNRDLLEAYAEVINSLGGEFTTGKDVGIGDEEIAHMSRVSPYINGRVGGEDPSIFAALGVFWAMQTAMEKVYGSADMRGRTISIKGLGQVGYELARLVNEAGGRLIVSDIDEKKIERALETFNNVEVISSESIHKASSDIYAPCALGGEFNSKNIEHLDSDIICGAANNQLASREVGRALMDRGIVYVPDYVANAGGLIAVVDGFAHKDFNVDRVKGGLSVIRDNVSKILNLSLSQKRPTHELADELAESIYG